MADAQVSGTCDGNIVWVQLPPLAPKNFWIHKVRNIVYIFESNCFTTTKNKAYRLVFYYKILSTSIELSILAISAISKSLEP